MMRTEYLQKIEKYVFEAKKLVQNGVSVDILAITPLEKWRRLLKSIEKNSLKNPKKMQKILFLKILKNWKMEILLRKKFLKMGRFGKGFLMKIKDFWNEKR